MRTRDLVEESSCEEMRQSIIVSRKMENEMMFEDDEVFDSLGQGIHNLLLTNA